MGTVLGQRANQTLSVTFTPSDTTDYNAVSATTTINVDKATPAIIWYNPIDISYGTALSATQLDATCLIPGSFVYSPPLGTILDAGAGSDALGHLHAHAIRPITTPTVATVTINVDNGRHAASSRPRSRSRDPGGRFDGAPFPASVTVAGSGTPPAASLEGVTPTLTYYNERRHEPGLRAPD